MEQKIKDLIAEYEQRVAERGTWTDEFCDEDGDLKDDVDYDRYDDVRLDQALDAEDDLHSLLYSLSKLAGSDA